MNPDDTEHPDALSDAAAIDRVGGRSYVEAIGELDEVLNSLFDGAGDPAYVNASRQVQDLFYEEPPCGRVRMFTRQFWGSRGASIVAGVGLKNDRPALLSIVAVALAMPAVGRLDYPGAQALARTLACQRCVAMYLRRLS